jgi:predicted enzyme related to lactoylglutathione lyase
MPISAVALLVPDYDAGIKFYVDCAGFILTADIDMGGGKRWVTVTPADGGCALVLARAAGDQARAIGQQTGGRVGFFLTVADFAASHARMVAAGVTFEEAPRTEPYGMVAVWRDPWGNRWDLLGPA